MEISELAKSKYRLKKVLIYSLFTLIFALIGILVFEYIRIKPRDVHFTNVTSSSVTVSWNTKSPVSASVIAYEGDAILPLGLLGINKEKFYDTRDVRVAELEVAQQTGNLTIDDFQTEIKVRNRGKYYTHHVTVNGLKPETEYTFSVGDELLYRSITANNGFSSVKTWSVLDRIVTPYPVYGSIRNAENRSNVSIDELSLVPDAIVYFNFYDELSGERSNILSSSVNQEGNWYIDVSLAMGIEGTPFLEEYDSVEENVFGEIKIDAGPDGTWMKKELSTTLSPTSISVLNSPNTVGSIEIPGSLIKIEDSEPQLEKEDSEEVTQSTLIKGMFTTQAIAGFLECDSSGGRWDPQKGTCVCPSGYKLDASGYCKSTASTCVPTSSSCYCNCPSGYSSTKPSGSYRTTTISCPTYDNCNNHCGNPSSPKTCYQATGTPDPGKDCLPCGTCTVAKCSGEYSLSSCPSGKECKEKKLTCSALDKCYKVCRTLERKCYKVIEPTPSPQEPEPGKKVESCDFHDFCGPCYEKYTDGTYSPGPGKSAVKCQCPEETLKARNCKIGGDCTKVQENLTCSGGRKVGEHEYHNGQCRTCSLDASREYCSAKWVTSSSDIEYKDGKCVKTASSQVDCNQSGNLGKDCDTNKICVETGKCITKNTDCTSLSKNASSAKYNAYGLCSALTCAKGYTLTKKGNKNICESTPSYCGIPLVRKNNSIVGYSVTGWLCIYDTQAVDIEKIGNELLRWRCSKSSDGSSDACSAPIEPEPSKPPVVDLNTSKAKCGIAHNGYYSSYTKISSSDFCEVGNPTLQVDHQLEGTPGYVTWSCKVDSPFSIATCRTNPAGEYPVCGDNLRECKVGTWVAQLENEWSCRTYSADNKTYWTISCSLKNKEPGVQPIPTPSPIPTPPLFTYSTPEPPITQSSLPSQTTVQATEKYTIDFNVPCNEKRCYCPEESIDKHVKTNEYCRHVRKELGGSCDIYHNPSVGDICSKDGNTCVLVEYLDSDLLWCYGLPSIQNNLYLKKNTSTISQTKLRLNIFGQSTHTSQYILDFENGIFTNIFPGTYEFTYEGKTYYFSISESDIGFSSGNVLIYIDSNNNNQLDEDIDIVVSDLASVINIKAESMDYKFNLTEGFNFITIPYLSTDVDHATAAGLLSDINQTYGDILFSISKFDGKWKIVGQNVEVYDNNDFQIIPGQGYIIKAKEDVSITLTGSPVQYDSSSDSAPIALFPGWNLIGLYGTGTKQYTAKSLIKDMNNYKSTNFTADNVSRWKADVQMYDGYQLTVENGIDMEYGFDYPINTLQSFFVRIKEGKGNWQPSLK